MKTIRFQQIADSRFSENIVNEIERLKTSVDEKLATLGIKNEASGICEFFDWHDGTRQYRVDYKITKTKDFTYNQLFEAINSVKAPVYSIK